MKDWEVTQGGSTKIKTIAIENLASYTIADGGDADYIGNIIVLDPISHKVVKEIVALAPHITEGFIVGLLPAHTQAIGLGTYLVVFEISATNSEGTKVYNKELSWNVTINKSLLNTAD